MVVNWLRGALRAIGLLTRRTFVRMGLFSLFRTEPEQLDSDSISRTTLSASGADVSLAAVREEPEPTRAAIESHISNTDDVAAHLNAEMHHHQIVSEQEERENLAPLLNVEKGNLSDLSFSSHIARHAPHQRRELNMQRRAPGRSAQTGIRRAGQAELRERALPQNILDRIMRWIAHVLAQLDRKLFGRTKGMTASEELQSHMEAASRAARRSATGTKNSRGELDSPLISPEGDPVFQDKEHSGASDQTNTHQEAEAAALTIKRT